MTIQRAAYAYPVVRPLTTSCMYKDVANLNDTFTSNRWRHLARCVIAKVKPTYSHPRAVDRCSTRDDTQTPLRERTHFPVRQERLRLLIAKDNNEIHLSTSSNSSSDSLSVITLRRGRFAFRPGVSELCPWSLAFLFRLNAKKLLILSEQSH